VTKEAVSIRDLNYSYPDGTVALEDINITIEEGERIAIIGQNGAGKTTLFLHLNGTIKSHNNNVVIFGKDIGQMKSKERIEKVGIVFQDPDDQLFMPTIFDDVAFGPINMGLDEDEVERRVRSALATVGLTGFEDRVPHHLSYGQKKRAALAAVLSMEPRILVLDEPTANLDPRNRISLIRLINNLNRNKGTTTIVAMHDVNAVSQLADRIYVLNKRMVADGSPTEIFMDFDLLRENNLDAPDVFRLFNVLSCFGFNCESLPLSIDDAVEVLTKTIEGNGKHIHLHIHEHTHEDLKDIMHRYDHHAEPSK